MLKNIKTGTCDYVKYQFKAIFFAIFCNYLRNFDVVQIIYVIHKLINVNATIVSNTPPHWDISLCISRLIIAAWILITSGTGLDCHASGSAPFASGYNVRYYTMADGLPHNYIHDLYRDSNGFLWVSTQGGGLSRFDGYEYVNYSPGEPYRKLNGIFVFNVAEDRFKRLWAATDRGVEVISLNTLAPAMPESDELRRLAGHSSMKVIVDSQGAVWFQSGNTIARVGLDASGEVEDISSMTFHLNPRGIMMDDAEHDGGIWAGIDNAVVRLRHDGRGGIAATPLPGMSDFPQEICFHAMLTRENETWIASDRGIYRYNHNEELMKHYTHSDYDATTISHNFVTDIEVDSSKRLVATTLGGLNIYNPMTDTFERVSPYESSKIRTPFIISMLVDGEDIWIATEGAGIGHFTPKRLALTTFSHNPDDPASLSRNPVNAILEDSDGTLWAGTVEGGLNRQLAGEKTFTHYTLDNGILNHNSVSALAVDGNDRLWVGTWGGGVTIVDRKKPDHVLKRMSTAHGATRWIDFTGFLINDSINGLMWMGTNDGVYVYDFNRDSLDVPFGKEALSVRGSIGAAIDNEGFLWLRSIKSIYKVDLKHRKADGTFKAKHYNHRLDDPSAPYPEHMSYVYCGSDGTIWIGTNGNGLYRRTTSDGQERFINYNTSHGLANNSLRTILEDDNGKLWISTNNGLSCFDPATASSVNFNEEDGLMSNGFYWNAAAKTADGRLLFGNNRGIVRIDKTDFVSKTTDVPVKFTRLAIGSETVYAGSRHIAADISTFPQVTMHESDKSIGIEFAALNFTDYRTGRYRYRLDGFDNDWIETGDDRRFARYTNLSPGHYTLRVVYAPDGSGRLTDEATLDIYVKPFFYKTPWFIIIAALLAIAAVWAVFRWRMSWLIKNKRELERQVELRTSELEHQKGLVEERARQLADRNDTLTRQNDEISRQKSQLAEMNMKVRRLTVDRISFFTNITHEFRTPITLIMGPIQRALKLSYNPQVIEQLQLVERNSKYLLTLVNQLMDFRKFESGKVEIVRARHDFSRFIDELVTPFEAMAEDRRINLRLITKLSHREFSYDEDVIRKVLSNLITNAIKFTPDGGKVTVYAALMHTGGRCETAHTLYICVSDTGSGIAESDLPKVFDHFYQGKSEMKYPVAGTSGSGIGLYLSKSLVEVYGGGISVKNNRGAGCSFRVLLPVDDDCTSADETEEAMSADRHPALPDHADTSEVTILVVEDNHDMRDYIRSILRDRYHVLEASDGEEALRILAGGNIDFIVSDLMMPGMDGLELSRRVKENFTTSHIPFLMLTAKTSPESRLEGYRTGVDEYLLKPFDEEMLLARIDNILAARTRYQRKFSSGLRIADLNIDEESRDSKFMRQIMEILASNYKNSYFDVGDFSEAIGISRSLLNKKLQSLMGQSAVQLIRTYRLNIAKEIILKNRETRALNISEIAYEVGYNDSKYFTKCFMKQFGVTPSAMLNGESDLQETND